MFDLLVLGSGIAGLSGAVHASRAGRSVLVLTKGELAHSATRYAQGGVAAALDVRPEDSPELHRSDTITAGAGLCDPDAVRVLVTEGPDRVRELIAMGAVFDQTGDGEAASLALAREGGHSAARSCHTPTPRALRPVSSSLLVIRPPHGHKTCQRQPTAG